MVACSGGTEQIKPKKEGRRRLQSQRLGVDLEPQVLFQVGRAEGESGEAVCVCGEILQSLRRPEISLKQVHRGVSYGCVVVVNSFDLGGDNNAGLSLDLATDIGGLSTLTFPSTVDPVL